MEIFLDKRAVKQIKVSAQDAIDEGDTDTLREDVIEAFNDEQIEEIERRVDRNDSHATQVSRTDWVLHGGLGPKVNHSCSPNCGVRLNDSGACNFVARESIVAGQEITFDYAMRNYSVEHFPGGCLCGSDICRGSITGWKDLADERKAA